MSKEEALEEFKEHLLERMGGKIAGLYLYGSLAKGEAKPESDVDLLVIYRGVDKSRLMDELSAIAFEIACKHGELIEPIPMSQEEFASQLGRSPFLWEVLKHGRAILAVKELTK